MTFSPCGMPLVIKYAAECTSEESQSPYKSRAFDVEGTSATHTMCSRTISGGRRGCHVFPLIIY